MKLENLPEEIRESVKESILAGKKIEAIKTYRESSGKGLKDSKEVIEAITENLRKDHPELQIKQAGCASVVIIGLVPLGLPLLRLMILS